MDLYGTKPEQLAEVAVAARKNASLNPLATYRDPITVDDVLASRFIAEPLHLLDCCIRTDGGGALVLTTEERARDLDVKPVWVLGSGYSQSHIAMSAWDDFTMSPAREAAADAYREAGVAADDIDYLGIYDSFTITVLLTLEALGVCDPGESGAFVEGGTLAYDGSQPANTDGGGLSCNQPGMRGLFLLIEAVRQLRGEAGDRQLDDPRLALCNGTGGWMSSAGTVILGNE